VYRKFCQCEDQFWMGVVFCLFVCFCLRMSASCNVQGSSIVDVYHLVGLDKHGGNVV
jgi:hypothetical protein